MSELPIAAPTTSSAKGRRPARRYDIRQAVANTIRQIRHDSGLSIAQIAELLGISYQQWHKYEMGINRMSIDMLAALARALGQPMAQLLGRLDDALDVYATDGAHPPRRPLRRPTTAQVRLITAVTKVDDNDQILALERIVTAMLATRGDA